MAHNNFISFRATKGTALSYTDMDTNLSSFFYSSSISGQTLRLHYTGSALVPVEYSGGGARDGYQDITIPSTDYTTLPTSSGSLSAGDLFTQTATELGGSGVTKVVCVA